MNKEFMLTKDLGNWLFYAENCLNMPENEATVMWHNHNSVGKFLICESREDESTRLFIRNVTNPYVDALKKDGWWNTFAISKTKTAKGLWLAKAVNYRLDRNGFLNLEVQPIVPVDDIKFHKLFSFLSTDGTWNSIAWWLMIVRSEAFLDEYEFSRYSYHEPNYDALLEKFPSLSGKRENEIGYELLLGYLRGEVDIAEVEECLNTPTDFEKIAKDLQMAVAIHSVEKEYGEKYPLFASKIANNVVKNGMIDYQDVVDYLNRQLTYYHEIVTKCYIKPIDGGVLDKVEAALQYRKKLKDAEKAAKKEERRLKKSNIFCKD